MRALCSQGAARMTNALNLFDDPEFAKKYDEWYEQKGRRAGALEKQILQKLLTVFPQANSVLEVGCGTGHFTR